MNSLDIFLAAFMAFFALHFAMKGFFNSAFILLGWSLAFYTFTWRFPYLEELFFSVPPNAGVHPISYLVSGTVAIVSLWISYYLGEKASQVVRTTGFSEGDRILGMLLGIGLGWYAANGCIYFGGFFLPFRGDKRWQSVHFEQPLQKTQQQIQMFSGWAAERWGRYQSHITEVGAELEAFVSGEEGTGEAEAA